MSTISENSANRENIFFVLVLWQLLLSLFRLSGNCGCQINWRELQKGQTTENLGPQTISGFRGESLFICFLGRQRKQKFAPSRKSIHIESRSECECGVFGNHLPGANVALTSRKLKYFISSAATTNGNRKSHVSYLSPSKHPNLPRPSMWKHELYFTPTLRCIIIFIRFNIILHLPSHFYHPIYM